MCGALEGLTVIPDGLKRLSHQQQPGQISLFSTSDNAEDWTVEEKIQAQREILGVSLAVSPFEQFADQIQSVGAVTTLEAQNQIGERISVAGVRQTWRRLRSRSNQMMCFLTLEDLEGSLQVLVSPSLYNAYHRNFQENGLFLVEGVIEAVNDQERICLIAEKITIISSNI
jgi:DNA polymerase-3 subunit alpha